MRRLNPGYKLLSLIIASLLLSVTFHTRLNLLVCGTSLLAAYLTPGVNRKRLSLTLIPFVLTAAGLFTAGLFSPAAARREWRSALWDSEPYMPPTGSPQLSFPPGFWPTAVWGFCSRLPPILWIWS